MYRAGNALKSTRSVRTSRCCRQNIRLQSTTASGGSSSAGSSSLTSHAVAGLAGGSVVALLGYSYYHYSGAKRVIDGATSVRDSFVQSTQALKDKAPSSNEILKYMRSTAKTYAMFIPGASQYVDTTFDSFDELTSTHGEEADKIIKDAYSELTPVIKNGKADQETALKVFEILRRRAAELGDLASRAGSDILGPILEKHPELKEKLGTSYEDFQKLASSAGPEASRILKEVSEQMKDVFSQGFDEKSIKRAKDTLTDAAQQIQKLGGGAGQEAWDKAKEQAQPYLDKFPDIKDILNEKAAVLMGSGASSKAIWDKLKEMGEQKGDASKEAIEEVKKFIEEKVKAAEGSGSDMWDKLQGFASVIPGGEKLKEQYPQLESFVVVLQDDSEEAKKLAKETFEDVIGVLKEKAEKAKKLGGKAKDDAKNTTSDKKDKKDTDKKDKKQ